MNKKLSHKEILEKISKAKKKMVDKGHLSEDIEKEIANSEFDEIDFSGPVAGPGNEVDFQRALREIRKNADE